MFRMSDRDTSGLNIIYVMHITYVYHIAYFQSFFFQRQNLSGQMNEYKQLQLYIHIYYLLNARIISLWIYMY